MQDPIETPPSPRGGGRLAGVLRRLRRPHIRLPRRGSRGGGSRGGLATLSSAQLPALRDDEEGGAWTTPTSDAGTVVPAPTTWVPLADALSAASAFVAGLLDTGSTSADASDDEDAHDWLAARCFPRRLHGSGAPQDLLTVGSRRFPLGISVHVYDFALLADADALRASAAAPTLRAHASATPEFGRALRSADDVPMTLVVRIARTLPVPLMRAEYARILGRRIVRVGGDPSDAALKAVVSHFRSDALPPSARAGIGLVRKGTIIAFTRGPGGALTATADGHHVVSVNSQALTEAVFDIYLGDEPACPSAQAVACAGAAAVLAGAPRPPRVNGGGLVCERGGCAARLD